MTGSVNIPVWAFGFFLTLSLAIVGGLIAYVKSFSRLATTVELLNKNVDSASSNMSELSKSVTQLGTAVAILAHDIQRIDVIDSDVRKIKTAMHLDH